MDKAVRSEALQCARFSCLSRPGLITCRLLGCFAVPSVLVPFLMRRAMGIHEAEAVLRKYSFPS